MTYVWIALGWMAFIAIVVVAATAVVIVAIRSRDRGKRDAGTPDAIARPERPAGD